MNSQMPVKYACGIWVESTCIENHVNAQVRKGSHEYVLEKASTKLLDLNQTTAWVVAVSKWNTK